MTQQELDSFAAAWNRSEVLRYLGIELSFPDAAICVVALPVVLARQRGGKGSDAINGGVLAALFDFAIGGTAMLAPPLRRNATAQLNLNYQRAVRGDSARCVARIDRVTKNLLFSSAELFDSQNEVCAKATGIVSLGSEITLEGWSNAI